MKNEKGSILAFVLVLSIVAMIICASLARTVLMRSKATTRLADGMAGKKKDDAAVSVLISAWTAKGRPDGKDMICNNTQANLVGYSCTAAVAGAAGHCMATCVCTPTPACTCPAASDQSSPAMCPPTVTVTDAPTNPLTTQGVCQFRIDTCQ